jgi:hypothetical protein
MWKVRKEALMVTIITNNHPREIIDAWDLTVPEREEFDYLDWEKIEKGEDSREFVRYKDELIDLGDIEVISGYTGAMTGETFKGWEGIRTDSFFSGLLFKWVKVDYDWEWRVIVGRYYT